MAKYRITPSSRTIVQSPISIGHKAEKGVEAIEFDVTAWVETYGSGTLTVIMRRWGDAIPYPIALEIDENNKATWTLSDTDTARAGMAYAQLSYIVGETVVKKSDIYTFRVMDSLTGEGEPPEAYESWLEHLTHLAAEAMAEVLDIEGIVTDKTLTVDGGIADAKATGDALALKADKSTTYTKAEVDQMIEDVDVETDTTLTVSGAPADAKKTGDELSALKADLGDVVLNNILYSIRSVTLTGTRYVYQDIFTLDNVDASKQYTLHIESATGVTNSSSAYIRLLNSNDEQISQFGVGTTYPVDKTVTPTAQTAKIVFRLYAAGATALEGDAVYTDVKVIEGTEVKKEINSEIGYPRLDEDEANITALQVFDAVTNNVTFALTEQSIYAGLKFESGTIKIISGKQTEDIASSIRARTDYIPVKIGYRIYTKLSKLSEKYRWFIWKYDESKAYITAVGITDIVESYTITHNGYIRIVVGGRNSERLTESDFATLTSNIIVKTIGGQNIEEYAEQLGDMANGLNTIPSYWLSDLTSDIGKIQLLDAQIGAGGDSFVFITDTHIESNAMVSPRLIANILKKTSVDKVVHGGDIFSSDYTKSGAIAKMYSWFAQMQDARRYYQVRGNHDINDSIDGVSSDEHLTDSEYYGVCVKRSADYIENDNCLPYYYFDNTVQKIRYFVLDTGSRTTENVSTYMNTQLSWMETLIDALDDTWGIVVFLHIMFVPKTSDNVGDLTLSDRGTLLKNKLDTLYGRTGKPLIIGVVAGHVHRDYSTVSSAGYPIIATSCDTSGSVATTYDPVNTDRTHGTVNEQLFDVYHIDKTNRKIYLTRIGAGLDREFTY